MIYVLNKSKILSYVVASFIVLAIFAFSTSIVPNKNIELLKVSTDATNNSLNNVNNINSLKNNY